MHLTIKCDKIKKVEEDFVMKKVLEDLLHVKIEKKTFNDSKKLPLILQGSYDIKLYNIAGEDILFVKPKEQMTFPTLKKHWKKFQELLEIQCVIYDDNYTKYGKERMIELGIPFIFGKDNVYLPTLGVALRKSRETQLPEIEKFSPFTQKLVLTAIYNNWMEKPGKEISEEMSVSRITVNRALVELQALGLPLTLLQGKTRYFKNEYSAKKVYELCKVFMINPIAKTYGLGEIPDGLTQKGGISALAEYSMIEDNSYQTYAIDREEARKIKFVEYKKLSKTEIPDCVVQVLRYKIVQDGAIDPISAILCLTDQEKNDPRIEGAIEETLEEVWNGKWNR